MRHFFGSGLAASLAALVVVVPSARATQTFRDPFAYCAAIGTIDAPDARYTGPAVPEAVVRGLENAFGVAGVEPKAEFERGTSWRCMDGAVYACNVGANLPCDAKPASDQQPTEAMRAYCAGNAGADFIPMYVTGRDTIYDWLCAGGEPRRGKRVAGLDACGYIASIWHHIAAPPAGR